MSHRGVFLAATSCGILIASAILNADEISSDSGLQASVSADGHYQVIASEYAWTFSGNIGQPLSNISTSQGTDGVGSWTELAFDYDPGRHSAIRVYDGTPVALFSTTYASASPNADAFPHFTNYPQGLSTLSYAGGWDNSFGKLTPHSPWLFFDSHANAFLFSQAANFMTATNQATADGAIESAIDSRIDSLPAGFTHKAILTFGGINSAFDAWGHALTGLSGKHRSANDSITLLNKLTYWTDAGSAYYYRPSDPTQYVPTLNTVPPAFAQAGVPVASMELDSWYYPKGSPPWWGANSGAGMVSFQADTTLFPKGLAAFQQSLGLPLITHARWIDASSPLRNRYKMSGNVSIDPQYWQDYANYLVSSGVEVLEQDWLHANAQTEFNLTDPDAFLDTMASAMAAAGRKLVYCMPLWGDIMQSSKYDNVVSVRISGDFLNRSRWDGFLFNTPIASAVGLWPFTDAFNSSNARDVLLATLSAGPVASGDAVGSISASNLRKAIRADGVIVKPDVPITPLDATFFSYAHNGTIPVIAATHSDHAGLRTAYVLAYDRTNGALGTAAFTPESLGITGPAYVYDYFNARGSVVTAGGQFTDAVDYNGSYYIVVPIGKSNIGFIGDAEKFASNGVKRIESLSDDGAVHASVRFAAGENSVVLHFYSPVRPHVTASSGQVTRVLREGASLYRVTVTPDATGLASVNIGSR